MRYAFEYKSQRRVEAGCVRCSCVDGHSEGEQCTEYHGENIQIVFVHGSQPGILFYCPPTATNIMS